MMTRMTITKLSSLFELSTLTLTTSTSVSVLIVTLFQITDKSSSLSESSSLLDPDVSSPSPSVDEVSDPSPEVSPVPVVPPEVFSSVQTRSLSANQSAIKVDVPLFPSKSLDRTMDSPPTSRSRMGAPRMLSLALERTSTSLSPTYLISSRGFSTDKSWKMSKRTITEPSYTATVLILQAGMPSDAATRSVKVVVPPSA